MSLENWQIGNIGTPDLVDRNNVDPLSANMDTPCALGAPDSAWAWDKIACNPS